MNMSISQASMIRGADGRLYSVTANGVSEIADTAIATARTHVRSGDRAGFETADHEAARTMIAPGA